MNGLNRREPLLLFYGDLASFIFALWVTLLVRYLELPDQGTFLTHFEPFSFLFPIWFGVLFIAGLYEKQTVATKQMLLGSIFRAQVANSFIAVLFFYLVPIFGITPKTNLFLYLIFSFTLVFAWRAFAPRIFGLGKKENALLLGSGHETKELREEINNNARYGFKFSSLVDPSGSDTINPLEVARRVTSDHAQLVVVDFADPKVRAILPALYPLVFSRVRFVDVNELYEEVFDRIPLSLIGYDWILSNVSPQSSSAYSLLKRLMDVGLSCIGFLFASPLFLLAYIMIRLDDGAPVFFIQERVGERNRAIRIYKFRTMSREPDPVSGEKQVTRAGRFLRKTRIDELPQLWNVLIGDLTLVGPRPEIPHLAALYSEKIPYYNVRHLAKPGLSGWAQITHTAPPKFGVRYDETKDKLSYDLYYLKHRSPALDLKIALRTLKTLLSRSGI